MKTHKQPTLQKIKKLKLKLLAGLVLLFLIISSGLFLLAGISFQQVVLALTGDYTKGIGDSLEPTEWNKLPADFVDQSGDTMSGDLTIEKATPLLNLKRNSGNPELKLADATSHWGIYNATEDGNKLKFWYGDNRLTITPSGNVGIGTTGPTNRLSVGDDITVIGGGSKTVAIGNTGGNSFLALGQSGTTFSTLTWVYNATPASAYLRIQNVGTGGVFPALVLQPSGGNVGIGTTAPGRKLHVQNTSGSSQSLTLANNDFAAGVGTSLQFSSGATTGDTYYGIQTWNTGETAQGNLVLQRFGGNVGIGTTEPGTNKLQVNGKIQAIGGDICTDQGGEKCLSTAGTGGGYWELSGTNIYNTNTGNVGIGTTGPTKRLDVVSATNDAADAIVLRPANLTQTLSLGWQGIVGSQNVSITTGGTTMALYMTGNNVGIGGTKNPGAELSVYGNAVIGTGYVTGTGPTNGLAVEGNVGIGTTGPGYTLDILGALQGYTNEPKAQLNIAGTGAYNGTQTTGIDDASAGGSIIFRGKFNSGGSYYSFARISGAKENTTDGNNAGSLRFFTQGNSEYVTEKMRITSAGNVGIGTTGPNRLLHLYKDSSDNAEIDLQSVAGANKHWAIYNERSNNSLRFWNNDIAGEKNALTILNNGNVGIGTTNPGAKLDLNFGTRTTGINISGGGAASGDSTTVRGINVEFNSNNDTDATKFYGIRSSISHNIANGGTAISGTFTNTVYSTGIGVIGTANHADMNGYGTAIGVKGVANGVGAGGNGTTYAGYFDNTTTVAGNNYGLYVKTASGGDYGIYQTGTGVNYFAGNVGIGTTGPGADTLDVRGRAYASGGWQTTDADYAEWFEKEEKTSPGDIIGINLITGKVRKYHPGDKFVGLHSVRPGVVGNRLKETDEEMVKTHTLVALLGQVDFNASQVKIQGRLVLTKDGQEVGVLLANGKVLIGR